MKKDKRTTNAKNYRNYPINNGKKKDFTSYVKTLDQVIDLTECSITKHSKVLINRVDIRNCKGMEEEITRKDMSRIMENSKRILERKYKDSPNKPDLQFVWAIENEGKSGSKAHCHILTSVNGNAIQNGYAVLSAVEQAVNIHLRREEPGLVNFSQSNGSKGIMIKRNTDKFQEKLNEAVYAGSYLAKTNTKEGKPKGARVSSASRLSSEVKQARDRFFDAGIDK